MGNEEDKSGVVAKFPKTAGEHHHKKSDAAALTKKKKSAPIAGFVPTAILTSSDGLFGDHIEEKRITETKDEAYESKTLYERLQAQKEEKEKEWKAAHNPFGKCLCFKYSVHVYCFL